MDITQLPYEIQFQYLLPLPYDEVMRYCLTNPTAYQICQTRDFWVAKSYNDFNISLDSVPGDNPLYKYALLVDIYKNGPRNAILEAVKNGNLDFLKFVGNNYGYGTMEVLEAALAEAAKVGNPDISKILYDEYMKKGYGYPKNIIPLLLRDIETAAGAGHLSEVEFLYNELSKYPNNVRLTNDRSLVNALMSAINNGHNNVVNYLDNKLIVSNIVLIIPAVKSRNDRLLNYVKNRVDPVVLDNGINKDSAYYHALLDLITRGNLEDVQTFYKYFKSYLSVDDIYRSLLEAERANNQPVVDFIQTQMPPIPQEQQYITYPTTPQLPGQYIPFIMIHRLNESRAQKPPKVTLPSTVSKLPQPTVPTIQQPTLPKLTIPLPTILQQTQLQPRTPTTILQPRTPTTILQPHPPIPTIPQPTTLQPTIPEIPKPTVPKIPQLNPLTPTIPQPTVPKILQPHPLTPTIPKILQPHPLTPTIPEPTVPKIPQLNPLTPTISPTIPQQIPLQPGTQPTIPQPTVPKIPQLTTPQQPTLQPTIPQPTVPKIPQLNPLTPTILQQTPQQTTIQPRTTPKIPQSNPLAPTIQSRILQQTQPPMSK
jgi:hypothetical protein